MDNQTTTQNLKKICKWCGRAAVDMHHLFRRSTSPQLKDDPNNVIPLCRLCHKYATEVREFEKMLQEKFFLKKDIELSVENIQEALRTNYQMAPREIDDFRRFLSGEFSYLSTQLEEVKMKKPDEWNKLRDSFKSDTACERAWESTESGIKEMKLKLKLKSIEKMLSTLRGTFELKVAEGYNNF
jgi:hypothetical protein